MAKQDKMLLAFNRGVVSSRGLARVDLERMAMSAEIQKNFVPRVLGSMMLRPGTAYIGSCYEDLNRVRQLPFVFGVDDTALVELNSGGVARIRIDDQLLERVAVSTTITNGGFGSGLTGWIDASDPGAFAWNDGGINAILRGNGTNYARIRQQVTVAVPDQFVAHGIRISCGTGTVFRVGSSAGDDDYIPEQILNGGTYDFEFTPGGDFWIELANGKDYNVFVNDINISGAGPVLFFHPYSSDQDILNVRYDQSGDVMYLACKDTDQRKIERRFNSRSWGIVTYRPENGPFKVQNTGPIAMSVSAIQGDADWSLSFEQAPVILTATAPYFEAPQHHGALFRLESSGQVVTESITSPPSDEWTNPIRVTGSEEARRFGIIIEGTFTATVTLQFAFTEDGPWNDQGTTWTAPTDTSFLDGQDGQIIYYRIGVKVADYTSGTVTVTLNYSGGSIQGICRVYEVTSSTTAKVRVLQPFGNLLPTKDWWEGEWSNQSGWPSAVAIHEGRLAWGGNEKLILSESDNFESFDDQLEGDARTISRTIGQGPIRDINWLLSMARLLIGTTDNSHNVAAMRMDGNNPLSARSSNFDEPLTVSNFNIKTISSKAVFVDRTEQRLYELLYDIDVQDYKSVDLSVYAPDFNVAGITHIAVQMKPDVRIHCVREDGTVGMLVYDRLENVICWIDIEMGLYNSVPNGWVEDVCVLPGREEDQVYYTVIRNTGPSGLGEERYLEKWALESEAIGGAINKCVDSHVVYDGAPTSLLTGLDHLQGLTVSIWADGADKGTAQVTIFGTPGELDLSGLAGAPFSQVVVGLPYTAQFKSTKLGDINGLSLLEEKKINRIGFIAENLHHQGLQYGPDFNNLYDLPAVEDAQVTPADTIYGRYHEGQFGFGGEWDSDSRICLQAQSPRPCTILAALAEMESIEKRGRR
ncbi:MAG: hypothetical protein AMJ84_00165 [Acidithiobacillales bacterium SM23_46]|nr:MAG: hypothetical protein AMJ84_00165 [Acidithiobacillales bacterium SM23_46]KPL29030.1 MAG: hypothetical protein AMJ72_00285 [Acidithiobacillales bacterium SM1_46]